MIISCVSVTEDKKLLRLCLIKCDKSAGNCWRCLLDGQYEVDPFTYDRMQQKLTLQRFQFEVLLLVY